MNYLGWIDYLRHRGVVSLDTRQSLAHMLRHERPAVRAQGIVFCNRMKQEHPDLWIAYRAKRRIIEGVTI
jgi:hypothetical protein